MRGMSRAVVAVAVSGAGIAVAVLSLHVARADPTFSFAGSSPAGAAALLGAGWASIGAGLASWLRRPRRRFGPLLAAGGFASFLLEWNNPGVGSAAQQFTFTETNNTPSLASIANVTTTGGTGTTVTFAAATDANVLFSVFCRRSCSTRSPRVEQCPRSLLAIGNRGGASKT
jgi:hypothetical protein